MMPSPLQRRPVALLALASALACWAPLLAAAAGADPAGASAPRGDAARGRGLAETCVPCHGAAGVSESAAFPIIAGQRHDYLVSAMLAYLSGARQDSIMSGSIRTLSRADIEDLAAYFSSLGGLGGSPDGSTAAGAPRSGPGTAPGGAPAGTTAVAAGGAPGAMPGGALAAAQAAADAARRLPRPERPATRGSDADGAERRACQAAARRAAQSGSTPGLDTDGDGVTDLEDAAPQDPTVFAVDADGDGRRALCNAGQLRAIGRGADALLAVGFELVADIDLRGEPFTPIGHCGPANNCLVSRDRHGYAGHFDGNGYTIRGLRIARPSQGGVGLFGTLGRGGVVRRVTLRDAEVVGANGTGLLVGASFGVIEDCDVQGTVRGRVAIGGIAGGNAGRILDSRADVVVEALAAAGGLVGDMNGTLEHSAGRVNVDGGRGAGGLVGLSTFGTVLASRVRGRVAGIDNVGGLVGVNTDALVESSVAEVEVTGSGTNVGGAVGYSAQSVVRYVAARGAVRGRQAVGGLVGRNAGVVLDAYATGRVAGEGSVGGLVGDNAGGTLRGAYWDSTTSGLAAGAGRARSSAELLAMGVTDAAWDGANHACRRHLDGAAAPTPRAPGRPGHRDLRNDSAWIFMPGRDYPRPGCLPEEMSP